MQSEIPPWIQKSNCCPVTIPFHTLFEPNQLVVQLGDSRGCQSAVSTWAPPLYSRCGIRLHIPVQPRFRHSPNSLLLVSISQRNSGYTTGNVYHCFGFWLRLVSPQLIESESNSTGTKKTRKRRRLVDHARTRTRYRPLRAKISSSLFRRDSHQLTRITPKYTPKTRKKMREGENIFYFK